MKVTIRVMISEDWDAIGSIYAEGIATGQATFETDVPDWEGWTKRHLGPCRLVAQVDDRVVGWAALSPVTDRCAYKGVAEVSIYVREDSRAMGVGRMLLEKLITQSEEHGIWTLQAGVFPENAASIALHKSCGFREIGVRERLGRLHGVWRDVLMMERRSQVTGT